MNEPRPANTPKAPEKLQEIARFQTFTEEHLDEVDAENPVRRSMTYKSKLNQSIVTFTATTIGEYTANISLPAADNNERIYIIACIVINESRLEEDQSRIVLFLPSYGKAGEAYMLDQNRNVLRPEGAQPGDFSPETVDSWLDKVEASLAH